MEYSSVLIQEAIDGDEAAFTKLYHQLSGKMYSLCLRYASNEEEANDWFQEGFIKLYKNLSAYRFEGSFEGWARRIFVTTCLDELKKKKNMVVDMPDGFDASDQSLDAIEKLDLENLIKTIQTLPDGYRTMINLFLVEEYSHKEIGEILNISEGSSKSRLHKARLLLKRKIETQNFGEKQQYTNTVTGL